METDPKKLSGKVAIVTGASSGIGLATARLLARHGVKVALVSRSKEKLGKLSGELPGSFAIPADMTVIPQVKAMVRGAREHFGRIDILVNNAGQGYDAPVELIDIKPFRYIYDLNLIGPIVAMQQVIPIMRAQGGGSILNISSGTALMDLPGDEPVFVVEEGPRGYQPRGTAGTGGRRHRRQRRVPVHHHHRFREEHDTGTPCARGPD